MANTKTPSWKSHPAFLGNVQYHEHVVMGKKLKFHPITVGALFRLRRLAPPLAKALTTLFEQNAKDSTTIQRSVTEKDGSVANETVLEAINPQLAQLRSNQRAKAIQDFIEAFTDTENMNIVAEILIDSLRDLFPPGSSDNPSPEDFVNQLQASAFSEMLQGLAAANREVLGPLLEPLEALAKRAKDQTKDPEESQGQPQEETAETAG